MKQHYKQLYQLYKKRERLLNLWRYRQSDGLKLNILIVLAQIDHLETELCKEISKGDVSKYQWIGVGPK